MIDDHDDDLLSLRAVISRDEAYRFWLRRDATPAAFGTLERLVVFVGLNPSTADATVDDPTVRRCVGYAHRWGYAAAGVVNLFPLRATDPTALLAWDGTNSGTNDFWVAHVCSQADLVVAAWSGYVDRVRKAVPDAVVPTVASYCGRAGTPLVCLGVTRDGHPRHPLYMRADVTPVPYEENP